MPNTPPHPHHYIGHQDYVCYFGMSFYILWNMLVLSGYYLTTVTYFWRLSHLSGVSLIELIYVRRTLFIV